MIKLLFLAAHAAFFGGMFFLYKSYNVLPEENESMLYPMIVAVWVAVAFAIAFILVLGIIVFWRALLSKSNTASKRKEEKIESWRDLFEHWMYGSLAAIALIILGTLTVKGKLFGGVSFLHEFMFAIVCTGLLGVSGLRLMKKKFPQKN